MKINLNSYGYDHLPMNVIHISSENNRCADSDASTLFLLLLLKEGTWPRSHVVLKGDKRNFSITNFARGIDLHILLERLQLNVEIIEWFRT